MDLARFCAEILDAKLGPIDPTLLAAFYRNTLRERGYYQKGHRSKFQLWQDLLDHYTPNFLGKIGLSTPAKTYPTWFARLTIRSLESTRHPLHHVLLLAFLFPEYKAFRRALAGFRRRRRKNETAGSTVSQPRDAHDPKLHKNCARCCWTKGVVLNLWGNVGDEAASIICSSTIRWNSRAVTSKGIFGEGRGHPSGPACGPLIFKVSKKHGVGGQRVSELCASRPDLAETRRTQRQAVELQKHKKRLARFLVQEPNADQARLQKKLPRSYIHVHRRDKSWLNEHFPQKKRAPVLSRKKKMFDWGKRDIEMELKLRAVAEQLKNSLARPIRLTKCGLLAKAGIMSKVYFYLERLPRTKKVLEELIDSDESFNRRKINWAIGALSKEGSLATKSAVIQKVSLRRKFGYLVDEALDMYVGEGAGIG